MAIIISTILLRLSKIIRILAGIMWALYWILAVLMSIIAVIGDKEKRNITNFALPFLFFILHISYGIGTMIGFIKLPSWLKGIKDGRNKER